MAWAAYSLRQGEIACRSLGGYHDAHELPLPLFLELCRDVRAYQADEEIRRSDMHMQIVALGAGVEESGDKLAAMLQDLNRIRRRPLD